jgi:hypothetical protein
MWTTLSNISYLFWIAVMFSVLPTVTALPEESPFPDITFKIFSQFIQNNFSSKISLSTVLVILFTMTENPDLLNLHSRQQNPKSTKEKRVTVSAWMKHLAAAVDVKLCNENIKLLKKSDNVTERETRVNNIGAKLDALAKILDLNPCNDKGQFQQKLKPVSHKSIRPIYVICPNSYECETMSCNSRSLQQITKSRDIPLITLIKNFEYYENVPVLTGKCSSCQTIYSADHERTPVPHEQGQFERLYLNSAKYIKVGQSIWVDRLFSNFVLCAMYNFHASAAAISEFWNNAFWQFLSGACPKLSRRQTWQAFVQESIRTLASASGINLVIKDGLAIDEVTREAFEILGEDGIIRAANQHACSECTHKYKHTSDVITEDPAALAGVDEDMIVPALNENENAQGSGSATQAFRESDDMEIDYLPVKLIVMDGIVMGPNHCAYDDCILELANSRGGVFCALHELEYGAKCRVLGCTNLKIGKTQACYQHKEQWQKHIQKHNQHTYAGIRRVLQHQNENLPWRPSIGQNEQPHDEPAPDWQRKTYFVAPRFYCVETICAPCGVVIAWAKFAKSESPTNILAFLEKVYPTEESRPAYICIDKACLVLRSSYSNGSWDSIWKKTSRFIVDSYHYTNHRTTDFLCRKWCNPAPLNGSAPNLVVVEKDEQGRSHYKRAFNTQVRLLVRIAALC